MTYVLASTHQTPLEQFRSELCFSSKSELDQFARQTGARVERLCAARDTFQLIDEEDGEPIGLVTLFSLH